MSRMSIPAKHRRSLRGTAPEETISVAFECLAGKKFHSDREKDDACAKLLFKGCRRLAVGYRLSRKIVDADSWNSCSAL